uniref:Uncharacterized protein n=1 Tax=Anguilla anguilla TaxID=7936 RepID=A0A0E9XLH5_ANGAN
MSSVHHSSDRLQTR